ncbi:hypothetical protein [Mycobacterium sp.]|uniref:hypothetical protein n=1 Tax=Mycobacterium sp. TaxID=1785 RepID=UPI003BAABDE7
MVNDDSRSETPAAQSTTARTIWPGIGRGFAHEELPKHLFTVAALHARRALAAAEHQLDQLDRAGSIGTAVELLGKAALTLISPTLIAERDAKSLLLYSGIPAISPHEAKTKTAAECLSILNHSHSIDFNLQRDSKIFSVRNFALHMGQVDATLFHEALNTMTRLNEAILNITASFDPTLDRTKFWGAELLSQVDERLKQEQEVRQLELDELMAAARRNYERLQQMGMDNEAFKQLADRDPELNDAEELLLQTNYKTARAECPVCGYEGWLAYTATGGRGTPWTEQPSEVESWRAYPWYLVEIELQSCEFVCSLCGLHLNSELLDLTHLDDHMRITSEANQEEIDALESYQVDSYLESEDYERRRRERFEGLY